MGSLNWHFTVDQYHAIQHIPLNETGRHADRGGPGDMYSIGIEMGEVRSHNPIVTWNRSAKLTAVLMKQYNIPLRNVVPHYYWTGKNCPAPLLTNGRPGYKWSWFVSRVDYYRRCLETKPAPGGALMRAAWCMSCEESAWNNGRKFASDIPSGDLLLHPSQGTGGDAGGRNGRCTGPAVHAAPQV